MSTSRPDSHKKTSFETLESRLVLSAQGLTDLPDVTMDIPVSEQVETAAVTLDSVHDQTGVRQVHDQYGFDGQGQTVVVIDSGIAWDHYALGGGYGEGYQVVGGWDFAEGDADPFDDPGAGYHGTHVAGIIGSTDSVHRGVASGVDLVSLRVFDDAGNGSLAWVEQALQWVHDHRADFENPITTVNLSLGTNWNANNLPSWATLEEEFAQLEADGIFISVAAGNSFQAYQSIGVSYPAVSDHVVPVASHDADGNLSDFSQRNERVLVAPGESIKSTVPGHLTGDAVSSKFIGASGTSMAAPYVAGSSVLIRQAMEFMGYNGIDQETIYQKLQETSDKIFDSLTGLNYNKINLEKALQAIVIDQHGDQLADATSIGTLYGNEKLTGTIGTFNDVDVFQFEAGRTGQLTLTFQQTHDLELALEALGTNATQLGHSLVLDVQAGQTYTLKLSTTNGIGHYTIDASMVTESVDASTLGTIYAKTINTQIQQQQWYQATAGRSGIFAAQLNAATSNASLEVYDSQQRLLGTATSVDGKLQLHVDVQAGQQLLLKVTDQGTGSLTLQNLIQQNGNSLIVHGNNLDNNISVKDGSTIHIDVDGMQYSFQRSQVQHLYVFAHGGDDALSVEHTIGTETAHVKVGQIYTFGSGYQLLAKDLQTIDYHANASDQVVLIGSEGDDQLTSSWAQVTLSGADYQNTIHGGSKVMVLGQGGNDVGSWTGSESNETVVSGVQQTTMTRGEESLKLIGFESLELYAGNGFDTLIATGSQADETLQVTDQFSRFHSAQSTREFAGFARSQFFGGGGDDAASLSGGTTGNRFYAYANHSIFENDDRSYFLQGFARTHAIGNVQDLAILYDSAGNDQYIADLGWAQMSGTYFQNQAMGFGTIIGRSTQGHDSASLTSYADQTQVFSDTHRTTLAVGGFQIRSVGFQDVQVQSYGDQTTAFVTASTHSDSLVVSVSHVELQSEDRLQLTGFAQVTIDGNGGLDDAIFQQLGQDESLSYDTDVVRRHGGVMEVTAIGFQSLAGLGLTLEEEQSVLDQVFAQSE